jgi:hypothetical protein
MGHNHMDYFLTRALVVMFGLIFVVLRFSQYLGGMGDRGSFGSFNPRN